jgi:hypothetical protein
MLKPWPFTIFGIALAALSVPSRSAVIAEGYRRGPLSRSASAS